jgi:hypothetical protein
MNDDPQPDSRGDLTVLRSAYVEQECADLIRKLRETPDRVTPQELFSAVRQKFASEEVIDGMMRFVQSWVDAETARYRGEPVPILRVGGKVYLWGPRNPAWQALFIRVFTSQVQQRFSNLDVLSQLGAMGKVVLKPKKTTTTIDDWFRRKTP